MFLDLYPNQFLACVVSKSVHSLCFIQTSSRSVLYPNHDPDCVLSKPFPACVESESVPGLCCIQTTIRPVLYPNQFPACVLSKPVLGLCWCCPLHVNSTSRTISFTFVRCARVRSQELCVKVEVVVLGSSSVISLTVSVDVNNNNNVHLSCTHQRPERLHDTDILT